MYNDRLNLANCAIDARNGKDYKELIRILLILGYKSYDEKNLIESFGHAIGVSGILINNNAEIRYTLSKEWLDDKDIYHKLAPYQREGFLPDIKVVTFQEILTRKDEYFKLQEILEFIRND